MKRTIYSAVLFLSIISAVSIKANDDIQYWNSVNINQALSQRANIHINLVQKFVRQMDVLGLWNYKPGITYHFSDNFSLSSNYQYEERIAEPEWVKEHRFDLVPVFRAVLADFNLRSQTKIEHRNIDGVTSWRIREKIFVINEFSLPKKNIFPFFTQEFFYSLTPDGFNQSRTQVGASVPVTSSFRIQFFYILKLSERPEMWLREHGIGTSFGIVL